MVLFKNVKILATNLERKYFTRHGMHLNALGNERVARGTAMVVRSLCKRKKTPSISLGWKDSTSVPDPNGIEPLSTLCNPEIVSNLQPDKSSVSAVDMMKVTTTSDDADKTESPNNLVAMPSDSCVPCDPGKNDGQILICQGDATDDPLPRTSNRQKKAPATKSKDFLW
jgi:hypothetical protein